jgi:hypothetical protein
MAVLPVLRRLDLLRVKGRVAIAECRGRVVVHFVQHVPTTSAEGNARRRRPRSGVVGLWRIAPTPALLRRTLSRLLWRRRVSGAHSRPRMQGHRKIGLSEFFTGYGMGAGPLTLSFLESYLDIIPYL